MPKRVDEPMRRVHIFVYEKDWELIKTMFGDKMPTAVVVRTVIRKWLNGVRARADAKTKALAINVTEADLASVNMSEEPTHDHTNSSY